MAGKGSAGEGDGDRLIDGDELNEERLLCPFIGGFIGKENDVGVPGIDGTGDARGLDGSEVKLGLEGVIFES